MKIRFVTTVERDMAVKIQTIEIKFIIHNSYLIEEKCKHL